MACISFFLTLLPFTGLEAEPALPVFYVGSTDKCGHFGGGQPGATGSCALRNGGTLSVIKSAEEPGMENQSMSP